jgi:hypothetical protein
MTEGERRHDEVLGARVTLTGVKPGAAAQVAQTLAQVAPRAPEFDPAALPIVVHAGTSIAKAQRARALLTEAGGVVEVEDVWVTRGVAPDQRARPACPSCGSTHTQPFTHAGPAARVNMRCTDCGHLFKKAPAS